MSKIKTSGTKRRLPLWFLASLVASVVLSLILLVGGSLYLSKGSDAALGLIGSMGQSMLAVVVAMMGGDYEADEPGQAETEKEPEADGQ